jgi:large subunit ribosomal protein L1
MTQHGKKYKESLTKADRDSMHGVTEAVQLVKSLASAKFDETIELAVRLGVDPRKADQIVRGTLSLPSGTGRTERVAVFAAGEAAAEARAAGADEVGADDLVARINGGFLDFDVAIATPDLMGQVGALGRVLGPRGLMPNPKTGTVTTDVGRAVAEFKGGRVEYRTDKVGNVHIRVGKASFTVEQLVANIRAVLDELQRAKPASSKGRYFLSVTISTTMSPGVRIDPMRARYDEEELAVSGRTGTESETPETSGAPLGAEAARWAGLTRRHLARRDAPACAVAPETRAESGGGHRWQRRTQRGHARSKWSTRSRRACARPRLPS